MSRRVRVHTFLVTELVKPQSQSWRACDLFRVSHWLEVPEDTEFPYTVPRLQVFTRFYLSDAPPSDFRIRILWEDYPSGTPEEIGTFGTYRVPFSPGDVVRDRSFNLHNIRLLGVGTHTVELFRLRRGSWTGDEGLLLARTFFDVER